MLSGMTQPPSTSRPPPVVRYSNKPLASYKKTKAKFSFGPATSALLDTVEAWNLAFLSFDYDTTLEHPDPQFTTNVRRSLQTRLDGSGLDICSPISKGLVVGCLLRLPAPRFVYLLRRSPALAQLPLYLAYGDVWLDLIEQRSMICRAEDIDDPSTGAITDLGQAQAILERIGASPR